MKNPKNKEACFECGEEFLTEEQINSEHIEYVWYNQSECCICNEVKAVTHIRLFNNLIKPKETNGIKK